ncbi:MAG: T9SS type A sorting domain-containing protein, partial [Bacteroidota bacterium]
NPEGIYNLKETKASINLYPNPATEQLIIDNGQLIIKEIEISDALGRIQRCEFKVQRPSTQIDIHSLPSGIYFIKVYFADGSMEVRRFVKE